MKTRKINISGVTIGGGSPLVVIAGLCVIENYEHTLFIAGELKKICSELDIPFCFKASYDKANRSSVNSYRGPGLIKGIEILRQVRQETGVPILTDVHETSQVMKAAEVADIIQIPAFLCRQTDLLLEAARSGKAVNVKKGQFMAPWDMNNVVKKLVSGGCEDILLTERGASFGYNYLVSDMRSIVSMKSLGFPVIFDATHSVQMPGGLGDKTGGQREFIEPLSRAAVAAGCDALFMEIHDHPEKALSDGPNSIHLTDIKNILLRLASLAKRVREIYQDGL